MVTTAIDARSRNLYTQILEAATERNDTEMLARLHGVPNSDLVAIEARYHRNKNCVPNYMYVKSTINDISITEYQNTLLKLTAEYMPAIQEGKEVFEFTTLLNRYIELLRDSAQINQRSTLPKISKRSL